MTLSRCLDNDEPYGHRALSSSGARRGLGARVLATLWFAAFWLFVLRARLALGRWPFPYDPDPKDLGFFIHYYFLVLGFAWVPASIITLLVIAACPGER